VDITLHERKAITINQIGGQSRQTILAATKFRCPAAVVRSCAPTASHSFVFEVDLIIDTKTPKKWRVDY
jgi:hypothetical protein